MSKINNNNGIVIECDPLGDFNDFRIVSTQTIEVGDSEANYALTYRGRVLLEADIDPILLARIFGIPSESAATIDILIQQQQYPISSTEAVLFAAFTDYVWNCKNQTHEGLLTGWGHLQFELKMMLGFYGLRPVLTGPDGTMPSCIQIIWEDWLKIQKRRRGIHDQFSKHLGAED